MVAISFIIICLFYGLLWNFYIGIFTFPRDKSLVEGVLLFISITSSVILLTWHDEEDLKFD